MSNVFIAFLLCVLTAMFTWYVMSERHEEEAAQFKKELGKLNDLLTRMSDERRELESSIAELGFSIRRYENMLERVPSPEED